MRSCRCPASPAASPTSARRPRTGQAWSPATVDNILRNPKYTGRVVLGRTTNTGPTRRKGERKVRRAAPRVLDLGRRRQRPPCPGPDIETVGSRPDASGGSAATSATPAPAPKPRQRGCTPTAPASAATSATAGCTASPGAAAPDRRQTYIYYVCPTQPHNPRDAAGPPRPHPRRGPRGRLHRRAVRVPRPVRARLRPRRPGSPSSSRPRQAEQHDHGPAPAPRP